MGFFSGYSSGGAKAASVLAGLANLGKLTSGKTRAPSSEATRVVRAFVHGEWAQGSCSGSGADRTCAIESDGRTLTVNGNTVMGKHMRRGARAVNVCFPGAMDFDSSEGGRVTETQESKDVRAVAGALFNALHTGIGIKTDSDGMRRLVGAHGRNRLLHAGGCATIRIPTRDEVHAVFGTEASARASARTGNRWPSAKEIVKEREAIQSEVRAAAAARAKLARDAAKAAKAEAAALAKQAKEIEAAAKRAAKASNSNIKQLVKEARERRAGTGD